MSPAFPWVPSKPHIDLPNQVIVILSRNVLSRKRKCWLQSESYHMINRSVENPIHTNAVFPLNILYNDMNVSAGVRMQPLVNVSPLIKYTRAWHEQHPISFIVLYYHPGQMKLPCFYFYKGIVHKVCHSVGVVWYSIMAWQMTGHGMIHLWHEGINILLVTLQVP